MYSMDKLKKIRKANEITIYDMAEWLGITASFYSQIENKKKRLFYDKALLIAAIFRTTPDQLFYISKEKRE